MSDMDPAVMKHISAELAKHDPLRVRLTAVRHEAPSRTRASDDLALSDRRGSFVSLYAGQGLSAALDHMLALREIVATGPVPSYAPWTLIRSVMDTAGRALWHLEPAASRVRVERAYAARVHDQEERRAHDLGRGPKLVMGPEGRSARDRLAEIDTERRAARFDSVAYEDVASILRRHRLERAWRIASGFAHAQEWQLNASQIRKVDVRVLPGVFAGISRFDEAQFLPVVIPAVALVERGVAAFEAYFRGADA